MDVLLATEITQDMLISTNAPVHRPGEVEWSSESAWPAGSLVTRAITQRVYRAVYSVPEGGVAPEENIGSAMLPFWQDLRPMNRIAMFDSEIGSQTVGPEGDLVIVVKPGATTDIWLGNLSNATGARVVVRDKTGGTVVYDSERNLSRRVTTYWGWWWAPFDLSGDTMFSGIPVYRNCEVTITIRSVTGAAIGMAAMGIPEYLGCAEWGPETDYRNYSSKQLDQKWGPKEGTGGTSARDQNYTVFVKAEDAPRVSRFMEKAILRPAVWLPHGAAKFEGIRGFGQAVDARLRYNGRNDTVLTISTKGFV